MRRILLAAVVAIPAAAGAQTPRETMHSQQVLSAAVQDIRQMERVELDALRDLFAACDGELSQNEVIQHQCSAARKRYSLEFGNGRSLDQLLAVLGLTASYFRSLDALPRGNPKRSEGTQDLARFTDVYQLLSAAISARYRELRQK